MQERRAADLGFRSLPITHAPLSSSYLFVPHSSCQTPHTSLVSAAAAVFTLSGCEEALKESLASQTVFAA